MAELLAYWRSGKVSRSELRRLWKQAGIESHFWPQLERQWKGRIS
jgi:hypothetical protein